MLNIVLLLAVLATLLVVVAVSQPMAVRLKVAPVVLLAVIGPALVFLRVEASWEKAIQGVIILVAVASDAINLRQRRNVGTGLAAH